MRAKFYILFIALFTISCNTVEKMVDQGRYDEAFAFSVRKIAGKKKKKTKYVKALEEAYNTLNNRDLMEIDFLLKKGSPASWDQVVNLYGNIERRQDIIAPFLPLRSKDGYRGYFEINDYSDEIIKAMELSAEYHFNAAKEHIELARNGDKRAARRALNDLGNIDKYFDNYRDSDKLKDEMYELGQEHVAIEIINEGGRLFGDQALDNLYALNLRDLNSYWVKFHRYNPEVKYDDYVVIELEDVLLGVEREWVNYSSFEKEIEDGYDIEEEIVKVKIEDDSNDNGDGTNHKDGEAKKKDKGKYKYETREVKVPKFRTVYADITEIRREKEGGMIGRMKVFTNGNDHSNFHRPLRANFTFFDEAVRLSGNRKALPEEVCARLDDNILAFPNDFEMVDHLAYAFKEHIIREIENYDFLYN